MIRVLSVWLLVMNIIISLPAQSGAARAHPDLSGRWTYAQNDKPNKPVLLNPGHPVTEPDQLGGPEQVPSLGYEVILSFSGDRLTIERPVEKFKQTFVVKVDLSGSETSNVLLGYEEVWTGHWSDQQLVLVTRSPKDLPVGAKKFELTRKLELAADGTLKIETEGLENRPKQTSTYKRAGSKTLQIGRNR
jgi:hypothetical protein